MPFKIRDAETVGWQAHLTYPLHMVFVDLSRAASWQFMVGTVDVSKQMRVVYALDSAVGLLAVIVAVSGFALCRKDPRFILPATLFFVGLVISVVTVDGAADSTARFILFLAPFYVIVAVLVAAARLGSLDCPCPSTCSCCPPPVPSSSERCSISGIG